MVYKSGDRKRWAVAGVRDHQLVAPGAGRQRGADHLPHQPERGVQRVRHLLPVHAPRHGGLLVRHAHARPQLLRRLLPGRRRQRAVGE